METTLSLKRDHTRSEILRAAAGAAHSMSCRLSEFRGRTLEYVLEQADRVPVVVFWGLWTVTDLQTVI